MPVPLINKIHKQTGIPTATIERDWQRAKEEANKERPTNKWAYTTSIVEHETGYKPNKED
jgi:hypothetical protein